MTRQRGASLVEVAILVVGTVAAVVAVLVYVRAGGDSELPTPPGAAATTDAIAPPSSMPARGVLVESTVSASGEVRVREWIRSSHSLVGLTLAVNDPDPTDGIATAHDVVVQSLTTALDGSAVQGTVLARQDTVTTQPVHVALAAGSVDLYLTYTIEGGVAVASASGDESGSDRMLANVLALDSDYAGVSGPVVHLVRGPAQVLSVGCLRSSDGPSAAPFPCGSPDDTGWKIRLHGIDRHDLLIASLGTA